MAQVGYGAAAKAVDIEEHGVRWTSQDPGDQEDSGWPPANTEPFCLAPLESVYPKGSETISARLRFPSQDGGGQGGLAKGKGVGGSRGKQAALRVLQRLQRAAHGGAHRNVPALCFDRKLLIRRS